jgi:hypothetical protein
VPRCSEGFLNVLLISRTSPTMSPTPHSNAIGQRPEIGLATSLSHAYPQSGRGAVGAVSINRPSV